MPRGGKPISRLRSERKLKSRNRRVSGEKTDLVEAGRATRWQPGTSGNPLGRPATKIFREVAREIAGMVDTKTKKTRVRKLMERAFKEAEKGSLGHFKQIHRLIEEDSISTQTRIALTAEASNGKEVCPHCGRGPKMSTGQLLETLRAIYGLGAKENPNKYRGPEDDADAPSIDGPTSTQDTANPQLPST